MAFLCKATKDDLRVLAEELGCEITSEMRVIHLKGVIERSEGFEENAVKQILANIVEERKQKREEQQQQRELEEQQRQRELEKEQREIEQRREQRDFEERRAREQREFELEKLRLESQNSGRTSTPENSIIFQNRSTRDFRNLIQKFDPEVIDISLYLALFERQAKKVQLEESDWVSQLTALLPIDVAQIILREPEELSDNYAHVKKVLLERFKLSPEAFRSKFTQHQRRPNCLWKDYVFDLQNYLEGWLEGLGVLDYKSLKELMVTDQLKRRASSDLKEHFLDEWGKFAKPLEFAKKADGYEAVRRTDRRPFSQSKAGMTDGKTVGPEKSRSEKFEKKDRWEKRASTEVKPPSSAAPVLDRNRDFERRKPLRCYECGDTTHLRPACPRRGAKAPQELNQLEEVGEEQELNRLEVIGSEQELLAPFISVAKVNGHRTKILRDSGATIDLVCSTLVAPKLFTGEKVWVRQPLDQKSVCLPVARVLLEGPFGRIHTKACVIRKKLDRGRYLLGNRTARLFRGRGGKKWAGPPQIGALTRFRHDPERQRGGETDNPPGSKFSKGIRLATRDGVGADNRGSRPKYGNPKPKRRQCRSAVPDTREGERILWKDRREPGKRNPENEALREKQARRGKSERGWNLGKGLRKREESRCLEDHGRWEYGQYKPGRHDSYGSGAFGKKTQSSSLAA